MSDQWGPLPIAQQFPAVAPDGITKLLDVIHRLQVDVTESRASILSSVAKIVADLAAKQAVLEAQGVTLAATVSGLSTAQATLATTVTNLGTAQADLAAQLVSINALVATVVVPAAFDASSSGFATTAAWVTKVSQTLTVPAGFTKAIVIANAHMGIANNSSPAVDAYMFVRAVINAGGGPSNGVIGTPPTTMLACFSAPFTSLVPGLSAGGTFTVDCQIFTSGLPAYAGNNARIEGAVIWFR